MSTEKTGWDYEIEARRIIDLLKKEFIFPDGSFFWEKEGKKIFSHHIHSDLGDFLPFFLYFGEDEFVDKQVFLYEKSLKDNLYISEFSSFGIGGLVKSYEYTDLLLGLTDLYEISPNERNKGLLLKTTETAVKVFNLDHSLSSYYYPKLGFNLPIVDTRDGTLIELFVSLYEIGLGEKYLSIAKNIYIKLINDSFYNDFSLLPTFEVPKWLKFGLSMIGDKDRFNKVMIFKNTTNSLFGFLSLAKIGMKEVYVEINKIITKLKSISEEIGGGIPITYELKNNKKSVANLTASFGVIDFLCDFYNETGDMTKIEFAKTIADFWIKKQGKTGLFPVTPDSVDSFFDSETDMTVALYKLWEKTYEVRYKDSADRCLEGIIKFHGSKDYVLSVNINDGEVINVGQRTKFLALFLKLLILKIKYSEGKKVYSDKELFNLLRDR